MLHRDIEREDKIEQGMWLANEGMWINKIDIQVLLSLFIEKGILTREEVIVRREVVGNSKKYRFALDGIEKQQKELQESIDFSNKMKRALDGTATDAERKEVSDWLDDYCNSFKKDTKS